MARKDLSRTVIEGGRHFYSRNSRRFSHGIGRARERAWLDATRIAPDTAEATAVVERPYVYRSFFDKLGPARRWLDHQVGRSWDRVFSELIERFDPRTTAGRHVVFDHMLPWVRRAPVLAQHHPRDHFYVDDRGILRRFAVESRRAELRDTGTLGALRAALTGRGWWAARPLLLTADPCRRLAKCGLDHDWTDEPRHYVRLQAQRSMTPREIRRIGSLAGPHRRQQVIDARQIAVVWPD